VHCGEASVSMQDVYMLVQHNLNNKLVNIVFVPFSPSGKLVNSYSSSQHVTFQERELHILRNFSSGAYLSISLCTGF